jgi:thiamine kinase-like enzyme
MMVASIEQSRTVLEEAAAKAGLRAHGAEVIRLSENDLWRLPGGVVARIARPGQHAAALREVRVTRWLAQHGVPAVRPLAIEQPVLVEDRATTFWEELPPHRPGTAAEIAPLLRQLHDLSPPGFEIGRLDPFVRIEQRLNAANTVPAADRVWLLKHCAELRAAWEELPGGLARCVIHGDAWGGNVAVIENGTAYLLDWERTSIGPPEWDLTSTAASFDTFAKLTPEEYTAYCEGYGHDVTAWAGYPTLRSIRELRQTSFALQLASRDPAYTEQANHRVACLRGRRGPRPWKWIAVP